MGFIILVVGLLSLSAIIIFALGSLFLKESISEYGIPALLSLVACVVGTVLVIGNPHKGFAGSTAYAGITNPQIVIDDSGSAWNENAIVYDDNHNDGLTEAFDDYSEEAVNTEPYDGTQLVDEYNHPINEILAYNQSDIVDDTSSIDYSSIQSSFSPSEENVVSSSAITSEPENTNINEPNEIINYSDVVTNNNVDKIVFFAPQSGERYHYRSDCRGLRTANAIEQTTLTDAIGRGLTLCGFEY